MEEKRVANAHTASDPIKKKIARALPTNGRRCRDATIPSPSQDNSSGASLAVNPSLKIKAGIQSMIAQAEPTVVPALRRLETW